MQQCESILGHFVFCLSLMGHRVIRVSKCDPVATLAEININEQRPIICGVCTTILYNVRNALRFYLRF